MANYYIDPENGSDSNSGTLLSPWKYFSKATVGNVTSLPAEVRVKKSPDPINTGLTSSWTSLSNQVTLSGTVANLIATCDSSETGWSGVTNSTFAFNASSSTTGITRCKTGTACVKFDVQIAFSTGKIGYRTLSSTQDLSSYQSICFWLCVNNTSLNLSTDLSINLCSDSSGDTPLLTLPVKSVTVGGDGPPNGAAAGFWTPVVCTHSTTLPSGVNSISFTLNRDVTAAIVVIAFDSIFACNKVADGLTIHSLIGHTNSTGAGGDDSDSWYPILYMDGTSVYIDGSTQAVQGLAGFTSGAPTKGWSGPSNLSSVNFYRRETFKWPLPAGARTGTGWGAFARSGTDQSTIVQYRGGWDFASDTQNGQTWIDYVNGGGPDSGAINYTLNYIKMEKFAVVRSLYGFSFSSGTLQHVEMDNIAAIACDRGFYTGASSACTISPINPKMGIQFLNNNMYGISTSRTSPIYMYVEKLCSNNMTGAIMGITDSSVQGGVWRNNTVAVQASAYGPNYVYDMRFYNSSHADIVFQSQTGGAAPWCNVQADNININSINSASSHAKLFISRYDGSSTDHRIYAGVTSLTARFALTATGRSGTGLCWKLLGTNTSAFYPTDVCVGRYIVSANTTATFNAWMYRSTSTPTARLRIRTNGRIIGGITTGYFGPFSDVSSSATWEQVSVSCTPTSTCCVEVWAEAFGTDASTHYVQIDDVSASGVGIATYNQLQGLEASWIGAMTANSSGRETSSII